MYRQLYKLLWKKSFGNKKISIKIFSTLVLASFILIALIVGLGYWGLTAQYRRTNDEILREYKPTSEIAAIAEKLQLSTKGKALFYGSNPEIVDPATMFNTCERAKKHAASGCALFQTTLQDKNGYPIWGTKILIMKFENPLYQDHAPVTAVHEIMHVLYDNLSQKEKKHINQLIDQETALHPDDHYLNTRKAGNDYNELHSVLGEGYLDLSPELTHHYQQLFDNYKGFLELSRNNKFYTKLRKMLDLAYESNELRKEVGATQRKLEEYEANNNFVAYNNLIAQYDKQFAEYTTKAQKLSILLEEFKDYLTIFDFYSLAVEPSE